MNTDILYLIINKIPVLITYIAILVFVIVILSGLIEIAKKAIGFFGTVLTCLFGIVSIIILLMLMFGTYTFAVWNFAPSELNIQLSTNDHTFKIVEPLYSIQGKYDDTDDGYALYPNLVIPQSVTPNWFVKK